LKTTPLQINSWKDTECCYSLRLSQISNPACSFALDDDLAVPARTVRTGERDGRRYRLSPQSAWRDTDIGREAGIEIALKRNSRVDRRREEAVM